jgi:hypothetical protein
MILPWDFFCHHKHSVGWLESYFWSVLVYNFTRYSHSKYMYSVSTTQKYKIGSIPATPPLAGTKITQHLHASKKVVWVCLTSWKESSQPPFCVIRLSTVLPLWTRVFPEGKLLFSKVTALRTHLHSSVLSGQHVHHFTKSTTEIVSRRRRQWPKKSHTS